MGTPILGMCKTKTYKEIENLIATIYSNDISDFGSKSYYPQILKIISSVNFRIFDGDANCSDEDFCKQALGSNINSIARGLGLPRETVRRKVQELIKNNKIFKIDNRLFVTKEFREKNSKNIEILAQKFQKLAKSLNLSLAS